ncbi:hypothetical protein Bra3105_18240 [Brachybacterium halotolerans subsp. kimchii]|uniref:hypothetical protein n=1 Tax=Brachybacterium halotolerans TaxID=2795215 RepID=UPI001E615465|nr:hypothetical protein [Brachybacterium halotolerans]UEJ82738.1 hypothetical protein Bra3105_18240 [Brachybacterium halotolerans subsp. kimchii]
MTNTMEHETAGDTLRVGRDEVVDWLIRTVIPECVVEDEDSEWFRVLPPYAGHTSTGRVRGWAGAVQRLERTQELIDEEYSKLLEVNNEPIDVPVTPEEEAVRKMCVAARQELVPSRLGFHAYRVLDGVVRLGDRAVEVHGDKLLTETDTGTREDYLQERAELWAYFLEDLKARGHVSTEEDQ